MTYIPRVMILLWFLALFGISEQKELICSSQFNLDISSDDSQYMGMMLSKSAKNYILPVLTKKEGEEPKRIKPSIPFYTSNLIKEIYQLPCYSLKSKKNLDLEFIKSQIYQKPQVLSILTYNIWFQSHNTQNRYPTILRMMADSNADVICLQEVNQQFLKLLHSPTGSYKKLGQYYLPVMKMNWYDTLILTKFPCRFYRKSFDTSSMGRKALMAVVQLGEGKEKRWTLGINCVHLQSLNNAKERINQLEIIQKMNEKMDMSVIAGDFNFSDDWEENKAIAGYTDIWKEGQRHLREGASEEQIKTGFTMPKNGRFPVWRPDHVIYRCKDKKEGCKDEIEVIGDFTVAPYEHDRFEMIAKDNQVRTPSDHFGLIAKIVL